MNLYPTWKLEETYLFGVVMCNYVLSLQLTIKIKISKFQHKVKYLCLNRIKGGQICCLFSLQHWSIPAQKELLP